jgi:uncharacterized membrane protein YphA (DoxX/SURF4 family)
MDAVFLVGRILFGGYFLWNGLNHLFLQTNNLAAYAASKKIPSPKTAVYFSGALIFLGGAGILFWVAPQLSAILIALFLAPVSFLMHDFWNDTDPNMKMVNMVNFTKNMALLGGALLVF